jgi:hypothetical protein
VKRESVMTEHYCQMRLIEDGIRCKLDRVDLLSRFLALGTRPVSLRGFELFFRQKQSRENANSGGVG